MMPLPTDLEAALAELPIFPLPQTVLFPGALLRLHVFEPRYRAMTRDCLAGNRAMAIARIRDDARRDGKGLPAIEQVAGLGVIIEHTELPDGRYHLLLLGRERVRLDELPFVAPYRRARATVLASSEVEPRAVDVSALQHTAAIFAADIRARDPAFDFSLPPIASPGAAVDLAAHHLVLDACDRQALLETLDVSARVQKTVELLAAQHAALSRCGAHARLVN